MNGSYFRGEVYYISPTDTYGSEQHHGRPGIIVSNDMNNQFSSAVEVVLLTTREKKPLPTHVHIESCKLPSTALCEQINTVDKSRIGNYISSLTRAEQDAIDNALQVSLGLDMRKASDDLLRAWRVATKEYEDSVREKAEEKVPIEKMSESSEIVTDEAFATHPAYIRMQTERDVYKELYMSLLAGVKN